jgi:hypothetical protein
MFSWASVMELVGASVGAAVGAAAVGAVGVCVGALAGAEIGAAVRTGEGAAEGSIFARLIENDVPNAFALTTPGFSICRRTADVAAFPSTNCTVVLAMPSVCPDKNTLKAIVPS